MLLFVIVAVSWLLLFPSVTLAMTTRITTITTITITITMTPRTTRLTPITITIIHCWLAEP